MGDDSGRVPRSVGEEVVEDLDDAPPVGQHPRQVRRQVDEYRVPAASAQEGFLAWSTKPATSAGWGETVSEPVSILPASNRSLIRLRI